MPVKKEDIPVESGIYLCSGSGKQECSAFATILRPEPKTSYLIPLCVKHASKGE